MGENKRRDQRTEALNENWAQVSVGVAESRNENMYTEEKHRGTDKSENTSTFNTTFARKTKHQIPLIKTNTNPDKCTEIL